MSGLYPNLIYAWERRLNRVDRNRRLTPFDWGAEWLRQTPIDGVPDWAPQAPPTAVMPALTGWNERVLAASADFFAYPAVTGYQLRGDRLTFPSPVPTPCAENRQVHARWFPAAGATRAEPAWRRYSRARAGALGPAPTKAPRGAVVVVAQWNADGEGHLGLCRLLRRAGISCLRVSMPYHDRRLPAGLRRAEYTVDANIGRTIHAARQAVCDIRASLDWLEGQGFGALGIVGTSLGSCYALLASAHDLRLRANVFNHISQFFGDVVWTGLATAHVRRSLESHLDQDQLREAWRTISPASYLDQYARTARAAPKKNLLLWARYDPCFLPEYSRAVLAAFRHLRLHHEAHALACGHYTIGRAPFKYADAFFIARFLRRHL
ncbi:MAG: alpha/beta hydrolase family protein [Terriglobales bacterium]